MAHRSRATVVICLFAAILNCGSGYKTYIVEKNCIQSGNLTITLGSGVPDSGIHLQAVQNGGTYSLPMDCHIEIAAPSRNKIVVAIKKLGFRKNFGGMCKDYIQFGGITKCEALYRADEERHFISKGNNLQMKYHVSKDGIGNSTHTTHPGFVFTITAVMEEQLCSSSPSSSSDEYYRCSNHYCIWSGFRCDEHNNCGDLSDEWDCGNTGGNGTTILIILGSLILLLLLIMCVATLLCSKNESVRRLSNRIRSRTISYMPRFSR